jgi:hypothetical protein
MLPSLCCLMASIPSSVSHYLGLRMLPGDSSGSRR